jgi:hypothetical protein
VDFVMARWTQFLDLHIYHYAPYEPAALKGLMERYATREEEIDQMLRAGLFVDLYQIVRRSLRASVEKRIRRLSLAEPYPKSQEVYLTIEFDDETEILIEVNCRPWFAIRHLARGADGELEPVKKTRQGSIRSLAKGRRRIQSGAMGGG